MENESVRIMKKYPDRLPVLCSSKDFKITDKNVVKFLVPKGITIGQFMVSIRNMFVISYEESIYVSSGGSILQTSALVDSVYEMYKDSDGILYMNVFKESTFG